ncbi:MAG: DNA repair protein RecO [Parcubacteria group bacterium Gr01-1014_70]|nr:MAG: DNA repair protein RecO [Parcubacteria group bacterium Gr01-1014_70]
MSYQLHETEGIVLWRWPRGEADMVLRLYTKEYGGVTLLAKGIRLTKSKLRGAVDLYSRTRVGFIAGKESFRLTHADLVHRYPLLREDAVRYRAVGHIADMFGRSVADGEGDVELWTLLLEAFSLFSEDAFQEQAMPLYMRSFEIKFLKQLGYVPETMPRAALAVVSLPLRDAATALTIHDADGLMVFLEPLLRYAVTQRWNEA